MSEEFQAYKLAQLEHQGTLTSKIESMLAGMLQTHFAYAASSSYPDQPNPVVTSEW